MYNSTVIDFVAAVIGGTVDDNSQQTRGIHTMLFQCWPTVFDAGPAMKQHWVNASCLLGSLVDPGICTRRSTNVGLMLGLRHRLRWRCPGDAQKHGTLTSVGLSLGERRRCLANLKPALVQRNNKAQDKTNYHDTTEHNTMQHNTGQHNTTQHNTTQHNTTQHNTMQHNIAQHSTPEYNATQNHSGAG